jgi:hypothetical protein
MGYHTLCETKIGMALAIWYQQDWKAMLTKEDAEQILEAMRSRPAHALDPLKAQEIEALILLEVDTLINTEDVHLLRAEGVAWSPEA